MALAAPAPSSPAQFFISKIPSYNSGANFTSGWLRSSCDNWPLDHRTTPSLPMKTFIIWRSFKIYRLSDFAHVNLFNWISVSILGDVFKILSAYIWTIFKYFLRSWHGLPDETNCKHAFSSELYWVLHRWGFGFLKMYSWTPRKLGPDFPRLRQCEAPGGFNFQTIFLWAKYFSILALIHPSTDALCRWSTFAISKRKSITCLCCLQLHVIGSVFIVEAAISFLVK